MIKRPFAYEPIMAGAIPPPLHRPPAQPVAANSSITRLTIAILGLLILVSARLDRVGTRQTTGAAVVNDGDSLTLGRRAGAPARHRRAGIQPDLQQGRRNLSLRSPFTRGVGPADRAASRSPAQAGSATGTGGCSATAWRLEQISTGFRSKLAGQSPMATISTNRSRPRGKKRGLWAGSFDRPRDWRDSHGGMVESEHDLRGRILNWLRQIFHFS